MGRRKSDNDSMVFSRVKKIPRGKVVSYAKIAAAVGIHPRTVGRVLNYNPDPKNIPCHRVVYQNGELSAGYSFGGRLSQRKKLINEGVVFKGKYRVDMSKSLWEKGI